MSQSGNFERCFVKNANPFQETEVPFFYLKVLKLKTQHFHTKLLCQKQMLRQIEWRVQSEPITKDGVLPVTNLFFQKFCFSLRTSYKKLI